ncbi:LuxR C-terminal-related transcriptional regulator [Streptomyces sp. NPDC058251]|uniref:LuxR C-terminal-related transcriptional regulator n=1 Tax=Streptomyces sp. NPDC058251 TaxID=3346404 RepID=UPI0036E503C3
MTSAVAVLDDCSVVSLDDSGADPGLAAALTSIGLSLLRRISASPRGTAPPLVHLDSLSHQDPHNGELFIVIGGWIDERRLLTTAVARSVVLRGSHPNTTTAPTAHGLHTLAQVLLADHVPEHLLDGAAHDPGLVGSFVLQARGRAWSLPTELAAQPTPAPYGALLAEQLNQLAPGPRLLTQALAVYGRSVPLTQLGRLLPPGQPTAQTLAPAVRAKLARWTDAGMGACLAQEITRGAVLDSLEPDRRMRLHQWAARCTAGVTSLLHRAAATDRPAPATAHALEHAARETLRIGQDIRAAQLFRLAADLSQEGADRERRNLRAVELALHSAHPPENHLLRAALQGATGPRADLLRARLAFTDGKLHVATDQLIRALEAAQRSEDDTHHINATCATWLAEAAWALDDHQALGRAAAAVDGCQEEGHPCADASHLVTVLRAVAEEGVKAGLDALAFLPADPAQARPGLAACLQVRGWLRLESCEPSQAVADTLAAIRLSAEPGAQPVAHELAVAVLAQAYCLRGEWDDAEGCAKLAQEIARPVWRDLCRSVHQLVLSSRGLPRVAGPSMPSPFVGYGIAPITRVISAHGKLVGGWAHERGRSCGTPVVATDLQAAEQYVLSHSMPWRLFDFIRAHCRTASVPRAQRLLAGLEQWPGATAWVHIFHTWAQALVAAADGQHEDASRYFTATEAAAVAAVEPNAWHSALISWDHARFLAQQGRWSKAVALLRAGQNAFERLEAWPMAEACSSELVRAQFMGSKERVGNWPGSQLSRREVEVASLAARGLTNNEIAQALFLSPGGVAYHLGNIYTKLGLRNRYQLRDAWESAMDERGP